MANAFNFGQTGSDTTALFNKVYRGAFALYPESSFFLADGPGSEFVDKQTLEGAKSLQNLIFGDVPPPEEMTPGDEFLGQSIAMDEVVSVTDDYILAGTFFKYDQMKQFSNASQLLTNAANRHREKINLEFDKRTFIMACLAARASAVTKTVGAYTHQISPGGTRTFRNGGSSTLATALAAAYPFSSTGASNVRADLRDINYQLDQKRIPAGPQNRSVFFHPRVKQALTFDTTNQVFSKDFVNTMDGENNVMRQEVSVVDGFRVLGFPNGLTNRGPLPDQNIVASSSTPTRYAGNFSPNSSISGAPVAVILCNDRGNKPVQLLTTDSLTSLVIHQPQKLGWLAMSYIKAGANRLHDWTAATIEVTPS